MKRRALISNGIVALFLCGCQEVVDQDAASENGSETPKTRSTTYSPHQSASQTTGDSSPTRTSGTDCPPEGELTAYRLADIPDSVTVADAEEDGFLENDLVSRELSNAARFSTPGGSDEVPASSTRGEVVAEASGDLRDLFGDDREAYVEYRNATYRLEYVVWEC